MSTPCCSWKSRLLAQAPVVLMLLVSSWTRANAETHVSGPVTANTTWELAHSPYVVDSAVVLESDVVLTIEPGVQVLIADGEIGIAVTAGQLICNGTAQSPIRFTSLTPPAEWYGGADGALGFVTGDWSEISHTEIEHVRTGIVVDGPLRASHISIKDCMIGIRCFAAPLSLDSSTITDSYTGIEGANSSMVAVTGSTIEGAGFSGINLDFTCSNSTATDCTFRGNVTGAAGPMAIEGSSFIDNSYCGFVIFRYGSVSESSFSGSEGTQIAILGAQDWATIQIVRNNFNVTGGYAITVNPGCTLPTVDARGNYWGTVDPAVVAARIIDANDDPALVTVLDYLPISDVVSTSIMSFSGLKAMFR